MNTKRTRRSSRSAIEKMNDTQPIKLLLYRNAKILHSGLSTRCWMRRKTLVSAAAGKCLLQLHLLPSEPKPVAVPAIFFHILPSRRPLPYAATGILPWICESWINELFLAYPLRLFFQTARIPVFWWLNVKEQFRQDTCAHWFRSSTFLSSTTLSTSPDQLSCPANL
jgi:hypothetical protein